MVSRKTPDSAVRLAAGEREKTARLEPEHLETFYVSSEDAPIAPCKKEWTVGPWMVRVFVKSVKEHHLK